MAKTFAVLDLKCKDMSAVAASWGKSGEFMLEGFSMGGSRGLHKGIVTDLAPAADSVSDVLKRLNENTGKSIRDVYASLSPSSIEVIPSKGTILLSKYGRTISRSDLDRCVDIGSVVKIPKGKEPLHMVVKGFSVDGEEGINNPVGLEGMKLSVDMNIVAVDSSAVRNLNKCVALAGYYLSGVIYSGIAYANRVLSEKDNARAVAVLNMCEDATEVIVFNKKILYSCKVMRMGSEDIIMNVEKGGITPMQRLSAVMRSLDGWDKVEEVIITGDAVLREGMIELMESSFHQHIRCGFCASRPFEDLPAERMAYIGSLGMLDYLQNKRDMRKIGGNVFKRTFNRTLRFIDKYF